MQYRNKTQIIIDIILKLSESHSLTRTTLLSYCDLNSTKHGSILDLLEQKEMIKKEVYTNGKKTIAEYSITPKGAEIYQKILAPYEELFPRE